MPIQNGGVVFYHGVRLLFSIVDKLKGDKNYA